MKIKENKFFRVLILFVFLSGYSTYAQDSNCLTSLRIGEFVAVSEDGKKLGYKVIRKKNKQTEIYNNGKSKIISRIKWLNDSTYTLTTLKMINTPNPGCDKIGAIATVKILDCSNSIQLCEWSQKGCGTGISRLKKISTDKK